MDAIPFGRWLKFYIFFINLLCDIVGLKFEYNQGGAVALLQRFLWYEVYEEKESLDGTSMQLAMVGMKLGWFWSTCLTIFYHISFSFNIYISFYFG